MATTHEAGRGGAVVVDSEEDGRVLSSGEVRQVVEQLRAVVAAVEAGALEATELERAHLAGAVEALEKILLPSS